MVAGVAAYAAEVRSGAFPGPEHVYSIDEDELRALPRPALGTRYRPTAPATAGERGSTYHPLEMPRLADLFAPRDRAYFELFEEAGRNVLLGGRPARAAARQLPRQPGARRARSSTASTRATGSPTTSSIGSTTRS